MYLRARYYAPTSGRFLSRDTWGGDANSPMSYNVWLYVYGNPVNQIDPNGQLTDSLCKVNNTGEMLLCVWKLWRLVDRSQHPEKPENSPDEPPPFISWDPAVNVNLSDDLKQNYPESQYELFDETIPSTATGLCGLIALAMVEETATGTGKMLGLLYNSASAILKSELKSGKILTCCLGPDTIARTAIDTLPKGQNWHVRTDAYQSVLVYTNQGSYYEHNNEGLWWGSDTANTGSVISSKLKTMLRMGHYVLVLSNLDLSDIWGRITINTYNNVGHWFVLTGMSQQWETDEKSVFNWVRINNPFSNRTEYYPWWYIKKSMFTQTPIVVELFRGG